MSNSFQFKQFIIEQSLCAMKVGTDGVLLGAWCNLNDGRLLDIGTGTGLVALMAAQRNNQLKIDAIDIENDAFNQASQNFQNSIWNSRLTAIQSSIQSFTPEHLYEYIVSNPPFFIASTKAPDLSRNTARHTDTLSQNDLVENVIRLLKKDGVFSIVLPTTEGTNFIELAKKHGLHLARKCTVYPNSVKPPKRTLMEFSFSEKPIIEEELVIETEKRHEYTKDYITLTKEFYLNM